MDRRAGKLHLLAMTNDGGDGSLAVRI